MLSDEEMQEIKQKIISHIESTFPAEQIANARQQIESMNSEQLESFMEKNKMIKSDNPEDSQCVFCSIVSGKIKSVIIGENEKAIAVLEINPVSRGHALIISKIHDKLSKEALALAKSVSKNIKEKFSPKDIEISKSKLFGHEIINLVPVYTNETINSEKKTAKLEELERIKEDLERKKPEKIKKKTTAEVIKEMLWLPKRIP